MTADEAVAAVKALPWGAMHVPDAIVAVFDLGGDLRVIEVIGRASAWLISVTGLTFDGLPEQIEHAARSRRMLVVTKEEAQ